MEFRRRSLLSRTAAPTIASFALCLLGACSSSSDSPNSSGGGDAGTPQGDSSASTDASAQDSSAAYQVTVALKFATDASGRIPLSNVQGAQFASPYDVTGKKVYGIMYAEGDAPPNDPPIGLGTGTIGADLTATFPLSGGHATNSYELAVVVSISGWVPTPGGIPGGNDLVAFTNPVTAPPPTDGVPYTGKTIRFRVDGADTTVNVDNTEFITYGSFSGGQASDAGIPDAGSDQ